MLTQIRLALIGTLSLGLLLMFGSLIHHLASLGMVEIEYEKGKTYFQKAPRKPNITEILCAWMNPGFGLGNLVFSIIGYLLVASGSIGLLIVYSGKQDKRLIFLTTVALFILSDFYILKIWLRNSGFYPNYSAPYSTCLAFQIIGLIAFAFVANGLYIHNIMKAHVAKILVILALVCSIVAVPASRWGFVREPYRPDPYHNALHDVVSLSFTIGFFTASLFLFLAAIVALALPNLWQDAKRLMHGDDLPTDNPHYVQGTNVVHVAEY